MEVEDACEGARCGGACLMGAAGAESQEEVGEGIGTAVRGAGGRARKRSVKMGVDLLCVNKIKAV